MATLTSEHCKFFVPRKKRYCKMLVKTGSEFCAEHQNTSHISEIGEKHTSTMRILCPLDDKHTVYAHKLDKHLKKCNAREGDKKPFIQKDVNSGITKDVTKLANCESDQALSSFSKSEVLLLIDKINGIYEEYVKLSEKKKIFPLVEKEMEKSIYGVKTKKHLKQISAIIGLLSDYAMLKEQTCFIEFGAGRGQLSCWIAEATQALEDARILLVERASPKHKRDNKLSRIYDGIERIRADIKDLVIDKLDIIQEVESVVGISKHLCGEATDLAIRCLTNTEVNKDKVTGAVLTFCCHHRCRWTAYTGKQFFWENKLSVDDFNMMCRLSSWATCGICYSRGDSKIGEFGILEENTLHDLGLNAAEKEEIGRRCKNIINWGRLKYFEEFKFKCFLHYYIEKDITLENVCIVASKGGI